jgi:hypothetical protein
MTAIRTRPLASASTSTTRPKSSPLGPCTFLPRTVTTELSRGLTSASGAGAAGGGGGGGGGGSGFGLGRRFGRGASGGKPGGSAGVSMGTSTACSGGFSSGVNGGGTGGFSAAGTGSGGRRSTTGAMWHADNAHRNTSAIAIGRRHPPAWRILVKGAARRPWAVGARTCGYTHPGSAEAAAARRLRRCGRAPARRRGRRHRAWIIDAQWRSPSAL